MPARKIRRMRKTQILIVLLAAIGSAWLTTLIDDGLGEGWASNVIRNWEQFGLFQLHGKMVQNPGGFQAETHPNYYAGHRPASLYPAFGCHHLLTAIGLESLGFYTYYALMAAVVLVSIWWLLGRTGRAFWLAAAAVLTPGYVRWQTTIDPNLTAVLLGFPFCAAVIWLLRRPDLKWRHLAVLFLLILCFSAINWTTVFVHAMLFATLLVLPRVPWRHVIIYAGLTAAMAGLVLLASLSSKMSHAEDASGGLEKIFMAYGWGNTGYGLDLTTKTALMRMLAANLLGLLPVLFYLGWLGWRRRATLTSGGCLFLLPLLMVLVEVLGMRNYFGHHPWMSVSFFLMGVILSALAWKDRATLPSMAGSTRLSVLQFLGLGAVFAYSFMVLAVTHAHNGQELKLTAFIRAHTARDVTIVIRREADPALADIAPRLDGIFDRQMVVTSTDGNRSPPLLPENPVILTTTAGPSEKILAQTDDTDNSKAFVKSLMDWYSQHIAHRRAGDRLEVGGKYYLVQPSSLPQS